MAFASTLKRNETARWWKDPTTFATSLLALALDEFGTELMNWEPETIRLEIKDIYNTDIPDVNMDKLLALITSLTTNLFYLSVESFTHVANAVNDAEADFVTWDPVEADEAAWAITEIVMNDPPKTNEELAKRFSHEVRRYIGVILEDEGITSPPDVLGGIAEMTTKVKEADVSFADDPMMFEGFNKLSQQKAQDVVMYVKRRTAALVRQLQQLPLQNRDDKTWGGFMSRAKSNKAISGLSR